MTNKKPNIIFIMIDSLRAGNLGCYGYSKPTSPNIDALAKQGVLFENCFSSNIVTYKSLFNILSGRYLLGKGSLRAYPSKEEIISFLNAGGIFFPEILNQQGYKTYFLKKLFGWQKTGFDYYYKEHTESKSIKWKLIRSTKKIPILYKTAKYFYSHFLPKQLANQIRSNKSGEIVTADAIRIINQINPDENFFLWIDYRDIHFPYNPFQFGKKFQTPKKKNQKPYLQILSENKNFLKKELEFLKGCLKPNETIQDLIDRYNASIAYDDWLIGKIINTIKEKNLLENTIVFLFADHAESLDEHEIYFNHAGVYDASTHVPLIILGKNIPKNKKINSLVQLEDIAPTILDLLNINLNQNLFDGNSLLPLIQDKKNKLRDFTFSQERTAFHKRAVRTNKYKYIEAVSKELAVCRLCGKNHGGLIELYNLEKDPDEKNNIAKKNPELLIKMKMKLNQKIKQLATLNEKRRLNKVLSKV